MGVHRVFRFCSPAAHGVNKVGWDATAHEKDVCTGRTTKVDGEIRDISDPCLLKIGTIASRGSEAPLPSQNRDDRIKRK